MNDDRGVVLEARGLKKVFRTGGEELVVFEEVDLAVRQGTTVVIAGESGSGKSTLLSLLGTLDAPTDGRITFRGREITGRPESELLLFRGRTLGFIFQFHYLLKDFTALENVMMPAYITGASRAQAHERALRLLEEVGLSSRLSHFPVELSGGERQRVAVARALVNDPELILADEPTGNLDERNSLQVQELLFRLVRDHRTAMVLVTHAGELARSGDEHYVLEHRRLRAP
jgi:lipoprotein-releasing system ATP-binding protein